MQKVIRPFQLSCNIRILEHNRKFYLTISEVLGFNLQTGEILFEYDYLFDAISCMGEIPIPDVGMPKPNGEYIVSGKFFSPEKNPVSMGNVKVQLGEQEKELFTFGPRTWGALGPSKPELITEMPLDYQHAFGGEAYERNPEGIGLDDGLLPCIENPRQLITAKGDRPEPVGYAPLDVMVPQRARFRGNYDNYMDKYFPGYPESTDWRFFLTAPEDQWIEEFYHGNESFSIQHMHPQFPLIEGALPNLTARCFVRRTQDQSEKENHTPVFMEKKLNLDTIWLFPEKMVGMLIWRGVIPVKDDEGSEITEVLAAYENLSDPPRDEAYYREALDLRLNSEDALLNHFKTLDLIPSGAVCAIDLMMDTALSTEESELSKNLDAKKTVIDEQVNSQIEDVINNLDKLQEGEADTPEVRKKLDDAKAILLGEKKAAADPEMEILSLRMEALIPGITTGKIDMKQFSFGKLDEMMKVIEQFTTKKRQEIDEEIKKNSEKTKEELDKLLQDPGITPETIENIENAKQLLDQKEVIMQPITRVKADDLIIPLLDTKTNLIQQIDALKQDVNLENPYNELLLKQISDMELMLDQAKEQLKKAEEGFREDYFTFAHFLDEGTPPHAEPVEAVTATFHQKISTKKSVANGDYACIDLSGKNLDGIDLSGALLEQVNFSGASLRGANLSGAVLARANLIEADFSGANLEKASIGAVNATRTNFSGANLNETVLARGQFYESNFSGCVFNKVDVFEAVFTKANFSMAEIPEIIFLKADFQQAVFYGAKLLRCAFVQCNLTQAEFSNSETISCVFVNSNADRTSFEGSNLAGSCFIGDEAFFNQNKFTHACLDRTNFRGMPLKGTNFSHSQMENALFNEADLTDSDFSNARAKSAQFRGAELTGANFNNIDLIEGSLSKAHLINTTFVNANLAYTDFLRCIMGNTNFRDANLDRTLIQDWRPS